MTSDFYKNLPKKRMSAGAVIFNEKNELLIVKPSYKEGWSIPGGIVDENESPRAACLREVKEEVGIELPHVKFLCIDYMTPRDEKGEFLIFIFYGGVLDQDQTARIKIQQDEISEHRFVNLEDARELLRSNLSRRVPKCVEALRNNTGIYLEDGN